MLVKEKSKNGKQSFMVGVMTLFFAEIIVKVMGLVYRLVITNIDGFGDEGNGLYGAGYQIYTLLLAVSSIGVPNAISKLVSERLAVGKNKEAHEIFKSALILFAGIGLVGSLLLYFFSGKIAESVGNPNVQGVMMALSPAIFFVAVASVIRGYFNGMYNMRATSNSEIIEQLFKSTLTIFFVQLIAHISISNSSWLAGILGVNASNRTVAMAVAGNAASTISVILGCIYLYIFYLRHKKRILADIDESKVEYKKEKRTALMKKILAISIPISIASIISAVNRNIDTFTVVNGLKTAFSNMNMTAQAITDEATRLYGILSGKVDILVGMPASLNVAFATALVPAISSAIANGDLKTAKRRLGFSLRITLLIALPCTIGLCVLAGPILNLLFPNAYSPEATLLMQMMSFTIISTLINQTLGGALQGVGKVYVPAISLATGALVKLGLNLLLIPHLEFGIFGGINGAAVSSVIASVVALIINSIFIIKSIKIELNIKQAFVKPIIITALMGTIAYFTNYFLNNLNVMSSKIITIISIFVAIISYLLLLILFKVMDKDDYLMLPFGEKIYNFLVKIKLAKA